ncbi:MAG: exodeoxyribonuclease VII large subunit [Candidatus Izemoplasmatales bacterium]|nr:exodeoxyribonuclease VII large subunit [Candidatus Izemoplasmatales bacterium]MDD4354780.1 exodeoxyribonuclease VII large subunit [Candidatus Izemoplasmatales bacterium]MDD4987708.1 exodeoxyribonuclease VII large subunit [Candidatus Izemoplasmatales bacterium]MDY0373009.1 exodeoxyribonuclease VII large subunit [Candidatus Izemoplasmatales bacterium]
MERQYLTVSALNRYLKFKFEQDKNLQDVLIKAEVSNFKRHSRGHLYFTLKDDTSQISAVMFFGNAQKLRFEPKEGSQVIVEGYVSVYEVAGTYQVYVTKMSEAGVGDLYRAFEMLKKKMESEGLFQEDRKRPLPKFPQTIGIITSPTGAAVRDIIQIIDRRYPLAMLILYPALVQGDSAKASITEQIEKANRQALCDLLIIGRGGGSIEDLWAFNEEMVVRAISASKIPTISAVGHETDFTLSDFVSDRRAPTPSGAAELAVPDRQSLLVAIVDLTKRMKLALSNMLDSHSSHLKELVKATVFQRPLRILETSDLRLTHLVDRLIQASPKKRIQDKQDHLIRLGQTLNKDMNACLQTSRYRFLMLAEKLDLVNPLGLMKKGFALVKKDQTIVKSVNQLHPQDLVDVQMHDGSIHCQVLSKRKDES